MNRWALLFLAIFLSLFALFSLTTVGVENGKFIMGLAAGIAAGIAGVICGFQAMASIAGNGPAS